MCLCPSVFLSQLIIMKQRTFFWGQVYSKSVEIDTLIISKPAHMIKKWKFDFNNLNENFNNAVEAPSWELSGSVWCLDHSLRLLSLI
jgi:hypothetical protein